MTDPRPAPDDPDVATEGPRAPDEPGVVTEAPRAPAPDEAEPTPEEAPGRGDDEVADETAPDTPDEQPDWEALAADDGRSAGELLAALREAEAQRNEWLDDLRRKQAEFDNFRKRMMREANTQRIIGHAEVAERLLDVLDDFDRTMVASSGDEGLRRGVELVRDKLMAVLGDFGLRRIDDEEVAFDPSRHEAVQQVPGEADEPVVAQVLRPGYVLNDRVLRAAMVVVAQ